MIAAALEWLTRHQAALLWSAGAVFAIGMMVWGVRGHEPAGPPDDAVIEDLEERGSLW